MRRTIWIAALAFAGAGPVAAQQAPGPDHVADLRECKPLVAPAEKLACLERAADALVGAVERGDLRLVNREQRERARRGLFGFSLGSLFGGDEDEKGTTRPEPEIAKLTSTITQVRQIDRKTWQFRLADGNALWQVNEAPSRFVPRAGDPVEIERAALGSYWVRVGRQVGVKGKRVG